jgi:hypothetical protein
MKIKNFLVLGITALLIFIGANLIFSQEPVEPDMQWLWGEVSNVDLQNKTILVKYLDYETDQEKEISITIDDKTNYENIKSIDELKAKDTVSIDYIVSLDGKNIARNISAEKPETPMPKPESLPETTPEDVQPAAPAEQ